ncbi:MAG: protein-L-isoaspartate(D-aspartate) O-methyltransferase [Gammaproteobacteria bacterium]|nr:protein-L-isoaspartate(D-aspartate) O-methyltransferase [Gammaproteobacteria bacterium]
MAGRLGIVFGLALGLLLALLPGTALGEPAADAAKHALWADVDFKISRLHGEIGFGELSPAVRDALHGVPRDQFVPERQRRHAFENRPLPIGFGQTISQPLIVAIMSELLAIEPGDSVFELGTGSGYQAAVLDALGARVYSVEIIPELAERARDTLDRLGHGGVETRVADGYFGWPQAAPFDAIIVTAATDHVPPPLLQQLKTGGRMVIPVGSRYSTQKLVYIAREPDGTLRTREILPVTFVPLTGGH